MQNAIVQDSAYIVPVHNKTRCTFGPNALSDRMLNCMRCTIGQDAHFHKMHIQVHAHYSTDYTFIRCAHSNRIRLWTICIFGLEYIHSSYMIYSASLHCPRPPAGAHSSPFSVALRPTLPPPCLSVRLPLLQRAHSRDAFVKTARGALWSVVRLLDGVLCAGGLRRPRQ